eukprot:TRINITY_DN1702_c0_g1_i1.p1 TRINITY_DN1702_c0_g1~~TRINITY_DN1702_c0_g1_i1.p1  ORF type:complete len:531 (-),score=110.59 TRINITY_DN1702_c0_g1_i1:94-1650(-)
MKHFIFILIVSWFILFSTVFSATVLETKMTEIVTKFDSIAADISTALNDPFGTTSTDCDLIFCDAPSKFNSSKMVCNSLYPKEDLCSCTAGRVSFEFGCAEKGPVEDAPASLLNELCRLKNVDSKFLSFYNTIAGVRIEYVYLGLQSGGYYQTPAQSFSSEKKDPSCTSNCCLKNTIVDTFYQWEPRTRGWYSNHASAKKDIIIIVDISQSTTFNNKIDTVKQAVNVVIDTLTYLDHFNVIIFSSSANYLIPQLTGMVPGSSYYRALFKTALANVQPFGATNFEAGFRKGFEALDLGISNGNTSNCGRGVIFMTDGSMSMGTENVPDLVKLLNTDSGGNKKAVLFTFAIGTSADEEHLHEIACESGGIFKKVLGGVSIAMEFGQYFQYFAKAYKVTDSAWGEIYEGAGTYAGMFFGGVGRPLYNAQNDLIGVLRVDVNIADMSALADFNTFNSTLSKFSASCPSYTMTDAAIETLRPDEWKCTKEIKFTSTILYVSYAVFGLSTLIFLGFDCFWAKKK